MDVHSATLRTTKARVLQSGAVRITNARRMPSSGLGRDRALGSDRGPRRLQRLADEQHAGAGDADEPEGNHREGNWPERLGKGATEDRADDEPGPEDDRVDSERGPGDGVFDDVAQGCERRGRKRPAPCRADSEQAPSGDQLLQVRTAGAGREGGEE